MRISDWSSDVCSSDLHRNSLPNRGTEMTIRTILVDDEPLAIQGLQLRLEKHEDVEIVETCSNGREAIRAIKTHKPDLVLLDIQMPGFDGFSVIQGLMEVEPPLFVFVTAYSEIGRAPCRVSESEYVK